MINAIINKTQLGISQENYPYIILSFYYSDDENNIQTVSTEPIFIIDPKTETIHKSGAMLSLFTLMSVVGVYEWESLIGKAVRLDFNEEGKITSVYNIINNKSMSIGQIENDESTQENEEEK